MMQQQQPASENQISRAEYEARQSALAAQIAQIETRMFAEQTALKADVERKFDRLLAGMEAIRKEVVARDTLEPQLTALKEEIKEIKKEQLSRRELSVLRLTAIVGAIGALIAFLEFLFQSRVFH